MDIQNFLFWWSVISSLIGIILLCASIWQYFEAQKEREKAKAQIKVWMQDANGLQMALGKIIKDIEDNKYSSVKDTCNAIGAVQWSAQSIYQSLYEERCVTEKEYKERQKKIADMVEKVQNEQRILGKIVK